MTGNAQICTNIVKKRPKWTENSQNLYLMNRFDSRSKTQIFDDCISPPVYRPVGLKAPQKRARLCISPGLLPKSLRYVCLSVVPSHHTSVALPLPLRLSVASA